MSQPHPTSSSSNLEETTPPLKSVARPIEPFTHSLNSPQYLDEQAQQNLSNIRSILRGSKVTGTNNESDPSEPPLEVSDGSRDKEPVERPQPLLSLSGASKLTVARAHYLRKSKRIDIFIKLWKEKLPNEVKERAELFRISTERGDMKPVGEWGGTQVVALDYLTFLTTEWTVYRVEERKHSDQITPSSATVSKTMTPDTLIELSPEETEAMDISTILAFPQGIIDMQWLLEGSGVVARIETTFNDDADKDNQDLKKRMIESQYRRMLGPSLHKRMHGTQASDRYAAAELKSSLAVGLGHLTGMMTAGLLGFFLTGYIWDREHVGRYIGALLSTVIFIILEGVLFIMRDEKIQKRLDDDRNRQRRRRQRAERPMPASAESALLNDNEDPESKVEINEASHQGPKNEETTIQSTRMPREGALSRRIGGEKFPSDPAVHEVDHSAGKKNN